MRLLFFWSIDDNDKMCLVTEYESQYRRRIAYGEDPIKVKQYLEKRQKKQENWRQDRLKYIMSRLEQEKQKKKEQQ